MSAGLLIDPLPPVLSHSTLNLLAGASGVGKTSLVAYMARCFLNQEELFGHMPNKVPAVGYLGADRPWEGDTQLWFEAYGIPDIPHYSLVGDLTYSMSKFRQLKPGVHAEIFADILDTKLKLPPGSLLFVDPIALFIGASMNDYVKTALGCIDLYRVILARGLTVIGLDHSSKQKGDANTRYTRLQDRISGSMAKLGYSATQMYLAGPDETGKPHHTFLWNPHHAPCETVDLKQDPDTGVFSVLDPGPSAHEELAPALQAILDQLTTGVPMTTGQLEKLYADTPRATLQRHLKALKALGLLRQPRHGIWVKPLSDPLTSDDA